MHKLVGCVRRAVNDYNMIQEGDHVAVGLSGGKDSLALLTSLARYRYFAPYKFTLSAIMVDMGLEAVDKNEVQALINYCSDIQVPLYIEHTNIAELIFDIRKESNPCSLCSKMRRGVLNSKCVEIGANKLALGHHSEDLLETFLLSFIYEGRLSTFQPVTYLSRTKMTVIRPFIYASEGDIKSAARRYALPVVNNPCPMNHVSQREYMKNLVNNIKKDIPIAKDRMFAAIVNPERYNLFPPKCTKGGEDGDGDES